MLVSILLKKCFGVLFEPLIYLFQLSFEKGVFPDDLKIEKVTPIYKVTKKIRGISIKNQRKKSRENHRVVASWMNWFNTANRLAPQ